MSILFTYGAAYALLIPVNKNSENLVIMLKPISHDVNDVHKELAKKFMAQPTSETFHAERIHH